MPANITPPAHYAHAHTAGLQARRETLLRVPRHHTVNERAELRAIEAELIARDVLSSGLDF